MTLTAQEAIEQAPPDTHIVVRHLVDRELIFIGLGGRLEQSHQDAMSLIEKLEPDTVCLSLCETRYRVFTDEEFWRELTVIEAIRQRKGIMLLATIGASAFQRLFALPANWPAGEEELHTMNKAKELGANWFFAERDLLITLQRSWKSLPFKRKLRLFRKLIKSFFYRPAPERIEDHERENHHGLMYKRLLDLVPEAREALVDECDLYLGGTVRRAEGDRVVTLLTSDRMDAVLEAFDTNPDTEALCQPPPPSKGGKLVAVLLPIFLIVFFVLGFFFRKDVPMENLAAAWFLPNMLLTGGFALIGLPRFRTLLASMMVSPFTPLSPALRSGIVAGMVEGMLRKPVVADCERISHDMRSLRGIYRNRFSRVLLVAWMAHIGSSLGNYVGAFMIYYVLS